MAALALLHRARATEPRDPSRSLGLAPGDRVWVRPEPEILASLDEDGTLDGLPFMPEMRAFCGRAFRVKSRADRTLAETVGLRRMKDTVHLDGARCAGSAHGGCARGCLLLWKEDWLTRSPPPAVPAFGERELKCTEGDRWFCQATEIPRASTPLSPRELRPYIEALVGEDTGALTLAQAIAVRAHDVVMGRLGLPEWNLLRGTATSTAFEPLDLQPGERVRVKRPREILATLDDNGWHRRMEFSREMLVHCGRTYTVLRRVERIIRSWDGKMVNVRDAVILDGVVYKDLVRLATPRAEWVYWRECWLERVEPRNDGKPAASAGTHEINRRSP